MPLLLHPHLGSSSYFSSLFGGLFRIFSNGDIVLVTSDSMNWPGEQISCWLQRRLQYGLLTGFSRQDPTPCDLLAEQWDSSSPGTEAAYIHTKCYAPVLFPVKA